MLKDNKIKAKGKRRSKMECPFSNFDEMMDFLMEPSRPKIEQRREIRTGRLFGFLNDEGRLNDLARACTDRDFRQELFEEYKDRLTEAG